jgi:hypothetical protein
MVYKKCVIYVQLSVRIPGTRPRLTVVIKAKQRRAMLSHFRTSHVSKAQVVGTELTRRMEGTAIPTHDMMAAQNRILPVSGEGNMKTLKTQ